jgi:hypothetical protein
VNPLPGHRNTAMDTKSGQVIAVERNDVAFLPSLYFRPYQDEPHDAPARLKYRGLPR